MIKKVVGLVSISFASAQAWWDNGHMLVGEIASQLLCENDRQTIERVLNRWESDFPNTNTITTTSIWPDLLKCSKPSSYCPDPSLPSLKMMDEWHYVNLPMNVNGSSFAGKEADLGLFKAALAGSAHEFLEKSMKTLNTTKSSWSVNFVLRNFIHTFADLHQPLHVVGGLSSTFPQGDLGGNLWKFQQPCAFSNLHALWDAGAGDYVTNWSNDTQSMMPALSRNASELIATLSTVEDTIPFPKYENLSYPAFARVVLDESLLKQMVLDSYDVALQYAYKHMDLTANADKLVPCPNDKYVSLAKQVSKRQIALGGKRLAAMLKQFAQQIRNLGIVH